MPIRIQLPFRRRPQGKRSRIFLVFALTLLIFLIPIVYFSLRAPDPTTAAWYDTSWKYRQILTVNNSASSGTLTNFPVLVKLESTSFDFNLAQSSGQDIRFADSNGRTLIDYDIEKWDSTNRVGWVWVEIPSLTNSAAYTIYMYYGNASASDASNSDNTWNSNYVLVQHLDETSGTHVDSTSNNNDSASVTITTQGGQIGKIDGADQFDGTDDVVQINDANSLDLGDTGTIETWVNPDIVTSGMSSFQTWTNVTTEPDIQVANSVPEKSMESAIVGDKVYWTLHQCNATNTVAVANSNLDGSSMSAFANLTADATPTTLATGSTCSISMESDGGKLYYAFMRSNSNTDIEFATGYSDLDGANSAWTTQTDPTGSFADQSSADLTIVGSKAYYVAVLVNDNNDGSINISTSNTNLDGTSFSGWTLQGDPVPNSNLASRAGVAMDSDGQYLYYALGVILAQANTDLPEAKMYVARSNLDGTGFTDWTEITAFVTGAIGGANDGHGLDMVIVGNRMYFALAASNNGTEVYQTGDANLDGSNFTGWTSQTSPGAFADGNNSLFPAIASDGKVLVYGGAGTTNGNTSPTTDLNMATSYATVTNRPVISKLGAYELVHSGSGFTFDWAGSPFSFGTTKVGEATHVAITQDGTDVKAYLNGSLVRTQTIGTNFTANTNNFRIGAQTAFFDGVIDEVRISSTAQSADWLQASYKAATNTLVKFGVQQEQKDPVAYWKLDEGVDNSCSDGTSDACDHTNNKNDLARTNAAWKSEELCIFRTCLFFDGDGDYLTKSSSGDIDFVAADAFTLQTWFRHEPISSGTQVLIAKANASAGYKLLMESDGDITCGIDDDTIWGPDESVTSTAATYDDNNWHLVTCVKNGTTDLRLYIDGLEVGTADTAIATGSLSSSAAFYLGIDGDGAANDYDGFLDEVKVYNYARTAAEMKTDALTGSARRGSATVLGIQDHSVLANGLTGYWKLDESSGNASDSSGNGTTLTNNSTTPYTGAKFGNGAELDGSTDFLDAADSATLSITGSLTLAAWIEPDDVTGTENIIAKWDGTNESYRLTKEGANLRMYIDADANYQASTGSPLSANAKTHVAGVYHAANQTVTLYVNGEVVASSTTGTIPSSIGDDGGDIHLGAEDSTTSTANYFDGHIDEARLYSRALSPKEIRQLYGWAPGPVVYWNLNENAGTTAFDSSSVGNNGTIGNGPQYSNGKYGSGLTFDGSNDVITIATAADASVDFNATEKFSGSAWVYITTMPGSGEMDAIIAKWDQTSAQRAYRLFVENDDADTTGNFQVDLYDESTDQTISATTSNDTVNVNTWYYLAFSFNGGVAGAAGDLKLYVNGVMENSNSANASFLGVEDVTSDFTVADYDTTDVVATLTAFTGSIDDIRIYEQERTSVQIVEDMNAGHPAGGSPVGTQTIYWKMDEQNGNTLNNSTQPSSLTGTNSGSTWQSGSNCKMNGCLAVDTSSDYISAGDVSFTDGSSSMSLTLWVNASTLAVDKEIIGKWGTAGDQNQFLLRTHGTNSDELMFFVASSISDVGNNYISTTDFDLSASTWTHIGVVYNGSLPATERVKMYKNGIPITPTITGTIPTSMTSGSTSTLKVGDVDLSALTALQSSYDEVKIYSGALSIDQIRVDMNAGASINAGSQTIESGPGNSSILYWNLDENTGTSISDRSGNGNTATGTSINQSNWENGKTGSAVHFDGAADYFSTSATFDPPGEGTVSFWMYSDNTPGATERLFGHGDNWEVRFTTSSVLEFDTGFSGVGSTCVSSALTAATWYHIAAVYSATNDTCKVYVNGTLYSSVSQTTSDPTAATTYLGRSSTADYFDGIIDEFKVFNYTLTDSQVAYDFNRGRPLGWWKFDECAGTTAYNSGSALSATGTITFTTLGNDAVGTCGSGTSTQMWNNGTIGKRNSSLDFDGSDDWVDFNDLESMDFTTLGGAAGTETTHDTTISFWFNRDTATSDDTVIGKRNGQASTDTGWIIWIDDTNDDVTFEISDGTDEFSINSTTAITATGWNHVTIVLDEDSASNSKIYFNGIDDTQGTSGTIGNVGAYGNAVDFRIGSEADAGEPFDGRIDDVRVYKYAMSSPQVKKLMNDDASLRFGPDSGLPN